MTDQTATADADKIVTTITDNAPGDPVDDLDDDDRRVIQTVLASLTGRSRAARQALAQALLDGDTAVTDPGHVSGLELDRAENSSLIKPAALDIPPTLAGASSASPRAHPVSGTSLQKTPEYQRSTPRSGDNCRTRASHSVGRILAASACDRADRHDLDCRTAV